MVTAYVDIPDVFDDGRLAVVEVSMCDVAQ